MEIGHRTGKCLMAEGNKEVDLKWTIMEREMDLKVIKIEVFFITKCFTFFNILLQ